MLLKHRPSLEAPAPRSSPLHRATTAPAPCGRLLLLRAAPLVARPPACRSAAVNARGHFGSPLLCTRARSRPPRRPGSPPAAGFGTLALPRPRARLPQHPATRPTPPSPRLASAESAPAPPVPAACRLAQVGCPFACRLPPTRPPPRSLPAMPRAPHPATAPAVAGSPTPWLGRSRRVAPRPCGLALLRSSPSPAAAPGPSSSAACRLRLRPRPGRACWIRFCPRPGARAARRTRLLGRLPCRPAPVRASRLCSACVRDGSTSSPAASGSSADCAPPRHLTRADHRLRIRLHRLPLRWADSARGRLLAAVAGPGRVPAAAGSAPSALSLRRPAAPRPRACAGLPKRKKKCQLHQRC